MDRFCYAGFPPPLRPRMDVALLLFLIFLNALFAMSEMALTASRKARLQVMVEAGDSGARHAMALHDDPTKWLSVVQIGITSIGILNGIVGDAAFSAPFAALAARAARHGRPRRRDHRHRAWSSSRSPSSASSSASWCPSGSACMYPETIARLVARPMEWLSLITRPFVRLLSWCTEATLRLLGIRGAPRPQRHRGGDRRQPRGGARRRRDRGAGAPDGAQRLSPRRPPGRLDDDPARRDRLARGDGTADDVLRVIADAEHSRYPVCRGGLDDVLGVISAQTLLQQAIQGEAVRARPGPAAAGVRARDALRHGAARAVPRLERAARVRRRRVRRGAGDDHGARRAGGDHRRVQHRRPRPTRGRCGATTAAGCSTA